MRLAAVLFWMNRVFGVLLFVGLGVHLVVQHFLEPGVHLTFERIIAMLHHPFLLYLDWVILVAALYKSLYGIRSVLYDYAVIHPARRIIDAVLVFAGIALSLAGMQTMARVARLL